MRTLVIFLLFLLVDEVAAQQIINTRRVKSPAAAASFALITSVSATNTGGPTSHALSGVAAGDLLVLATGNENSSGSCAVTDTQGLSWTKRVDAEAASSGNAEIWTAVYAAGGSITVTSSWGATHQAATLFQFTGQESSLGGYSTNKTAQNLANIAFTTTRAGSAIVYIHSDFNAASGTYTYRTEPEFIAKDSFQSPNVRVIIGYATNKSVSTYATGWSAPSGESAGVCIYEVRSP